MVIGFYVDDFVVFYNNKRETEYLKKHFGSKFDIIDLGVIKQCLSMQVDINRSEKTVKLN